MLVRFRHLDITHSKSDWMDSKKEASIIFPINVTIERSLKLFWFDIDGFVARKCLRPVSCTNASRNIEQTLYKRQARVRLLWLANQEWNPELRQRLGNEVMNVAKVESKPLLAWLLGARSY